MTKEPIRGPLLEGDGRAGAAATFEGTVRDLNEGLKVQALTYEAKDSLALQEGERIVSEAVARFALLGAACVHRVGDLAIGDVAIRVEARAMHRGEAFEACRYIVDEVKARVPIWKKEHYASGESHWLNCQTQSSEAQEADPSIAQAYYERQVRLPEIGAAGQAKLGQSRALVVGAGGLGCAALQYLAAAGVGRLVVCDPDRLETSNLHRQTLYDASDVGKPKAALAARRLKQLNPLLDIRPLEQRLTDGNADALVAEFDVVLDCTDNFAAKFALNDACVRQRVALVQASIYQYEGQVFAVEPGAPSGCLRCLWPQTPPAGCVGNCAEVGVLGSVAGVFGSLQAFEATACLLGTLPVAAGGSLLVLDLTSLTLRRVRRERNLDCPVCGNQTPSHGLEVQHVDDLPNALIVDIREPFEGDTVPGAVRMPMSGFEIDRLSFGQPIVLVCAHGIRSYALAAELRSSGIEDVYSLSGGLAAV